MSTGFLFSNSRATSSSECIIRVSVLYCLNILRIKFVIKVTQICKIHEIFSLKILGMEW